MFDPGAEPDSLAALDLVGPDHYARHGYPHAAWARLRREAPIFWCAPGGDCTPFWAVTKHADIARISRMPKLLRNAPRLAVFPEGKPPKQRIARHLLNMDPPEHAEYRKLASHRFTPRAIQSLRPKIERVARELLDAYSRAYRSIDEKMQADPDWRKKCGYLDNLFDTCRRQRFAGITATA